MASIKYREPPKHGEGLVVWPSPVHAGYHVTSVETYWSRVNAKCKPHRAQAKLEAALDAAIDQAERDDLLVVYVIEV